jgi:hypothetical protein
MESALETVALFCLKLAYEAEGQSPILRDDMVMGDYQRDVFKLLVSKGEIGAIQQKVSECMHMALEAMGGAETPLGRELQRISTGFYAAQTLESMAVPLDFIKGYLRDVL